MSAILKFYFQKRGFLLLFNALFYPKMTSGHCFPLSFQLIVATKKYPPSSTGIWVGGGGKVQPTLYEKKKKRKEKKEMNLLLLFSF